MASKRELTKFLNDLSKEELIKEFEKLYQKFDNVKTFYDIELSGDTSAIVKKVKDKIKKEYMPDRGFGKARSSEVKKIISEFAKVSIYPRDLIDVILYRVEMAVEFTKEYGDIDMPFYDSAINAFYKVVELIKKEMLENEFKLRCYEIVYSTRNFGWGFYDGLKDAYDESLSK